MKTSLRFTLACAALAAALALPGSARADIGAGTGTTVVDSGRLILFSKGQPMAAEDFQYETRHDSLFVTSATRRKARGADGTVKEYKKSMELIADKDDFGLLFYISNEDFDGHTVQRQVIASDTSLNVVLEADRRGTADALVRPPGRLFVLDGGMFALFDVISRNLHDHMLGPRPVPLVTLGKLNATEIAQAVPAKTDTIRWAGQPMVVTSFTLADSVSTFRVWASPTGQLLRLENEAADVVVIREEPAPPPAPKKPKPRAKPVQHAPAAAAPAPAKPKR